VLKLAERVLRMDETELIRATWGLVPPRQVLLDLQEQEQEQEQEQCRQSQPRPGLEENPMDGGPTRKVRPILKECRCLSLPWLQA
jgi:hypothetical protein